MEGNRRTGRTTKQLTYMMMGKFEVNYYVAKNNQMAKYFMGMFIAIINQNERCDKCHQTVPTQSYEIEHSRMAVRVKGRVFIFISECNLEMALKGVYNRYITIMDHTVYE